jgi:NADH:ubiquinone oxidoreductase subunit E
LRGSKDVVAEIEHLIAHYQLEDLVTLKGSFCLEQCSEGVTITIGDNIFKVKPDEVTDLFEKEVFAILYGPK